MSIPPPIALSTGPRRSSPRHLDETTARQPPAEWRDRFRLGRLRCIFALIASGAAFCALPARADTPGGAASSGLDGPSVEVSASSAETELVPSASQAATTPDDAATAPAARPDWKGAARDAKYFVSYQIVGVAALYLLPDSITGWSDADKEKYSFTKWRENVTHPTLDTDGAFVNYVLHPYWGGAYYIRARERGLDGSQAFWYSALMSALWEYGAEALIEPVSIQDLIATPVLGSLLGEYVMAPLRARIRAKPGALDWSDRAVLALTDPLGAINDTVDEWLGVKTTLQLRPTGTRYRAAGRNPSSVGLDGMARESPAGWRLQVRIDW